ncbi:MAG TPA: LuxR C-terminal-related transcriptional regulator [Terriglobia bacterium]|jgi:DNA-binding CsgD family transcriptional regulator
MRNTLSTDDFTSLLDFLHDMYQLRELPAFHRHAVTALRELAPADVAAYSATDMTRTHPTEHLTDPAGVGDDVAEGYEKFVYQHPLLPLFDRGAQDVVKIADLLSRPKFHDLGIYEEFFHPLRIEHQIAFTVQVDASWVLALSLNRAMVDFSERERQLLACASPHIRQAYKNAEAFTSFSQEARILSQTAQPSQSAVVTMTPGGRVLPPSPHAEALITRYFGAQTRHTLPDGLQRWAQRQRELLDSGVRPAPLVIEKDQSRLTVRMMLDEWSTLLLLTEDSSHIRPEALRSFGLTTRQVQVLEWLVLGKTNAEIGEILDLSPRTVQKHLENIYQKLGIGTRTAAVNRVWEIIRAHR